MNDLVPSGSGFHGFLKWMTTDRSDLNNKIRRNVQDYNPNYIDRFFLPEFGVLNTIVSGDSRRLRNCAILAQIDCSSQNSLPVIVIHENQSELVEMIRKRYHGDSRFIEISNHSKVFDPFFGLTITEISQEICEAAPERYDFKFNIRYYLDGIGDLLKKRKRPYSFKSLLNCPHFTIFDFIDNQYQKGLLTDFESNQIRSKLMMGQTESFKLESYINDLNEQIEELLFQSGKGKIPVSILSGIQENKILLVDITSTSNSLWLDILVFQMKLALKKGLAFSLIVDSISLEATKTWEKFIKNKSDNVMRTIITEDIVSMTKGEEKDLNAFLGNTQTFIVFRHHSGQSAIAVSKLFGEYDKYEKSISSQRGSSRNSPFSLFSSPNQSHTITVSKNRELVIKPEQIMTAGNGEAFIKTPMTNSIVHIQLID